MERTAPQLWVFMPVGGPKISTVVERWAVAHVAIASNFVVEPVF